MTTKERILTIKIINLINRNPEFAKRIGVTVDTKPPAR